MKIINFDGMAIFGPGSEWFWTMLQFIALTITFFAIYRQLRSQGSANALYAQASLADQWDAERMARHRLAVLMHVAQGKPGAPPALYPVANFLEDIATLQDHGNLRLVFTWEEWGRALQFWWALCVPIIREIRKGDPGLWKQWEKLAVVMGDLDRKAGTAVTYDAARLAQDVPRSIDRIIEQLRLEQEARAGLIPAWPLTPPVVEA